MNQKIKDLRSAGFSLREISSRLRIPYTTIQRCCKHVEMSNQGKTRYQSQVNGIVKKINFEKSLTKEKFRLISNLLFDGAVYRSKSYHYSIMYVNSSLDLIDEFKQDMKKVYGVDPSAHETINGKHAPIYRLKYYSKKIYQDLIHNLSEYSTSKQTCKLPNWINSLPEMKILLLRAFWENEGSISKSGKLSADLKNKTVIHQLSELHNQLGLTHYISRYWKSGWAYKLIIRTNKENFAKFLEFELFSKSIVTKGFFTGLKKSQVLQDHFDQRYT